MFDGILTAAGTLVIVIVILYLTYVCSRQIGRAGKIRGTSKYIRLVDQIQAGQDKSIAIIQTGHTYLLVGITSSQITLLKEMDESELEEMETDDAPVTEIPDFQAMMRKIGKRKQGR